MGKSSRRARVRPHNARHTARGVAAVLGMALVASTLALAPAQAGPTRSQVPETTTVLEASGLLGGVSTGLLLLPPEPSIAPGGGGIIEVFDQLTGLWSVVCTSDGTVAVACGALPLADLTQDAAVLLRAVPANEGDVPTWDPDTCPAVLADICMIPLEDMAGDSPIAPMVTFLPAGTAGAPDTTITSTVPGKQTTAHTFAYRADPASGTTRFECKLDVTPEKTSSSIPQGHDWQLCGSGETGSLEYRDLANGTYVFGVRALDGPESAPLVDETPATQSWTVAVPAQAPETRIYAGSRRNAWVLTRRVSYEFRGSVPDSRFSCTFDRDPQGARCNDGAWSRGKLAKGRHVFRVYARANDTRDLSPARRTFHVPIDDAALRPVKSWVRRTKRRGHFKNTFAVTTVKGAALVTKRPQKFRRIALIADKGPGHGTVKVVWNKKKIDQVSLQAKRLKKRRVIPIKRFTGKLRQGTLRVVVVSAGKTVRVDGLGVARR
jgi:hypothetical protein